MQAMLMITAMCVSSVPLGMTFWMQFFPLLTAVVISGTFLLGLRANRRLKTVDVTGDYQKRYEVIMYELRPRALRGEYDITHFYERYWNLQMDQFYTWRDGFITNELYQYWMLTRSLEQATLPEGLERARLEWERYYHRYSETRFAQFMDQILGLKPEELGIRRANEKIRRLLRDYHRHCVVPPLLRDR